jgi:hypothetical protein
MPAPPSAQGVIGIAAAAGATAASGQTAAPAPAQSSATPTGATAAGALAPTPRMSSRLRVTHRRLDIRSGRTAVVRGSVKPATFGGLVKLQRIQRGRWVTIDRARTSRAGGFVLKARPSGTGSTLVRVRFGGTRTSRPVSRRVGRLTVYRPALASWYGPGLYGNGMACGGTLTAGTVGVAHKSLPCGTKVTLRMGSRKVVARVIDRGPYVGAREFDLTAATKYRLGFGSTGTVWVAH